MTKEEEERAIRTKALELSCGLLQSVRIEDRLVTAQLFYEFIIGKLEFKEEDSVEEDVDAYEGPIEEPHSVQ